MKDIQEQGDEPSKEPTEAEAHEAPAAAEGHDHRENAPDHEVFRYHPPEKKSVLLPIGLLAIVGLAGFGYVALSTARKHTVAAEAKEREERVEKGPRVDVAKVKQSAPTRTITLSGEVRAYRQATLYAKVSGYLKTIRVDKGDKVKENEVLGIIESPEVEHEVASRKADLAIKRITDARFSNLAKSGVVSQQEMDTAKAQVDIAQEDLRQVEALRGYDVIRAPFPGIVTARYADNGALLQAATGAATGALPLVDIADMEKVRVFVYPGQADALFVKLGDSVKLWNESKPDAKTDATVTRFTESLDPRTRTMLTEIEVPNTQHLFYPGTFVKVQLTLAVPAALTIPADAVVYHAGRSDVAVVQDGKAHFVTVDAEAPDGATVRITKGLSAGDTVILHPGDDVLEGVAVQPVEKAPPPAASGSAAPGSAPPAASR